MNLIPMGASKAAGSSALTPFAEAQVEGALSILEREAGLSHETMTTLRQAVEAGLSRRREQTSSSSTAASNPGIPMFHMIGASGAGGQQQDLAAMVNAMQQAAVPLQAVHLQHNAQANPAASPGGAVTGPTGGTPVSMDHSTAHSYALVAPRSVKPSSSKRQQLTVEEAAEIYLLRPRRGEVRSGSLVHCRMLAPRYGVTAKTIRDVWSGRTWAEATRHLWTPEEMVQREKSAEGEDSGAGKGSDTDEVASEGGAIPAQKGAAGKTGTVSHQKRPKSSAASSSRGNESARKDGLDSATAAGVSDRAAFHSATDGSARCTAAAAANGHVPVRFPRTKDMAANTAGVTSSANIAGAVPVPVAKEV